MSRSHEFARKGGGSPTPKVDQKFICHPSALLFPISSAAVYVCTLLGARTRTANGSISSFTRSIRSPCGGCVVFLFYFYVVCVEPFSETLAEYCIEGWFLLCSSPSKLPETNQLQTSPVSSRFQYRFRHWSIVFPYGPLFRITFFLSEPTSWIAIDSTFSSLRTSSRTVPG